MRAQVSAHVTRLLHWLGATSVLVSYREQVRASAGAAAGLALTALGAGLLWAGAPDLPLLLPPLAATAVLIFAAPASPLAQPWHAVGGNVLSAVAGVACAKWIPHPLVAAAAAPACAIALMFLARCLHPPGGAVALTAVLGGPAIKALGFGYALHPIGLETTLLVLLGMVINTASGRRYPHATLAPRPSEPVAQPGQAEVTAEDVRTVLLRHDEVVDVDPEDLAGLIREVEIEAALHRAGPILSSHLMVPPGRSLTPDLGVPEAREIMAQADRDVLPVTDAGGRYLGAVSAVSLLRTPPRRRTGRLARGWPRIGPAKVAEVMSPAWPFVHPDTDAAELVRLMVESGLAWFPVVSRDGLLAGSVAQAAVLSCVLPQAAAASEQRLGGAAGA